VLGERVVLWPLGEAGSVGLGLNRICKREGLWALSLCTRDGLQVCQLSFSFLQRDRLMIGSVQGAAAHDDRAIQAVRDLTHAAEGLRPPFLLVEVLRALCQRQATAMLGVDPQHHVKKRWHQRVLTVSFDYCGFWTALGGQRGLNGMWALPAQRPARAVDGVPSKRRAQHRRKLAMLAAMPDQLNALLPPAVR